jgi:hypothetical protein
MIPTPILVGEPVQLSRNPFAHSIFIRRTVRYEPNRSVTCSWCGQKGRVGHWHRPFQYGTRQDDNNAPLTDRAYVDRVFCSVGCFRSYTT